MHVTLADIHPDDIVTATVSSTGEEHTFIKPPNYLVRLAQTKSPGRLYRMLIAATPPRVIRCLEMNIMIPWKFIAEEYKMPVGLRL